MRLLGFPLVGGRTQARHPHKRLDLQTKTSFMLSLGAPLQSENNHDAGGGVGQETLLCLPFQDRQRPL